MSKEQKKKGISLLKLYNTNWKVSSVIQYVLRKKAKSCFWNRNMCRWKRKTAGFRLGGGPAAARPGRGADNKRERCETNIAALPEKELTFFRFSAILISRTRALPGNGQPRVRVTEVTATVGIWGRLLLFVVVDRQKQSTQADDNQTELIKFRSRHWAAPLS